MGQHKIPGSLKSRSKLVLLGLLLCFTQGILAHNMDSMLNLLKTMPDSREKLELIENLCIEARKTDLAKAKEFASQQLALATELNITDGEASALSLLGGLAYREGSYALAMDYYIKSQHLFEKIGDKKKTALNSINIATILGRAGEYEKALEYNKKALKVQQELKMGKNMVITYSNMGIIYKNLENFTDAQSCYLKALEINDSLNDDMQAGVLHHNLGALYDTQKDYTRAIQHFSMALISENKAGDDIGKATTEICLGDVYNHIQSYKKALPYLLSGFKYVYDLGENDWVLSAYLNLADCYTGLKEHEKANVYLRKHKVLYDSIQGIEKHQQINELEIKYETAKKEQEIELLKQKEMVAQSLSEKRKLYIVIAVISAMLLLFGLLLIVFRNINLKKQQALELEKNRLVFEQQALRAQMNPHFIFNALNSIQSYILNNETQLAYDYLAKFSKLIRQVLQNSEFDLITMKDELELLNTYIQLENTRFKNRFRYEITGVEDIPLHDLKIPVMLIQPYVENAIWHGIMNLDKSVTGLLTIDLKLNEDTLKITIEDNGVGRKDASRHTLNTKKSMGMTFTQKRLDLLNAAGRENTFVEIKDLTGENGKATGTRIEISIRVN